MKTKRLLWLHYPDGEWLQCRQCVRKGYGVDSYHPFTAEFFPMRGGKLQTDRCKACHTESNMHMHGVVPERMAA